jgi:hypothetical protein
MVSMTTAELTIRRATDADAFALDRLAQLDSHVLPAAPALVAESRGRLIAAVSLKDDGDAIADPFVHSADAVALLRRRAAQIAGAPARRRRTGRLGHGLRLVSR